MKNDIKKWIDVWQQAGSTLEEIRKKELQSADYYENNFTHLNEMLKYAFEYRTIRLNSGLIEQQRLFKQFYMEEKV